MEPVEKVEEFIKKYSDALSDQERIQFEERSYDVWGFDSDKDLSDKLIGLILAGKKQATASSYLSNEQIPKLGSYGVIRDFTGDPVCIIRYTRSEVVPFKEVGFEFAQKEGEGFKNIDDWRAEHHRIFESEPSFNESAPILCQHFELAFPK